MSSRFGPAQAVLLALFLACSGLLLNQLGSGRWSSLPRALRLSATVPPPMAANESTARDLVHAAATATAKAMLAQQQSLAATAAVQAQLLAIAGSSADGAAAAEAAAAGAQLRQLVHQPPRVLAVIVYGWIAEVSRLEFVYRQLGYYVQACERGMDVRVVIIAYDTWNYTRALNLSPFYCSRTMTTLPVSVERFPLTPLPNGTFGTAGTLAAQQRVVFAREAGNFDVYVSQEDDIMIPPQALFYFIRWSAFFGGLSGPSPPNASEPFYPALADFELATYDHRGPAGEAAEVAAMRAVTAAHFRTSWRYKRFYIFRLRGVDFTTGVGSLGSHMMTSGQLARAVNSSAYLGLINSTGLRGEFNPIFSALPAFRWLALVVPVMDLHAALVHHATNRYREFERDANHTGESTQFTSMSWATVAWMQAALYALASSGLGSHQVW
eukprot:scaffold1.g5843.t1